MTLCRWYRFLKSPENEWEAERKRRIVERWEHAGGFTPAIIKALMNEGDPIE